MPELVVDCSPGSHALDGPTAEHKHRRERNDGLYRVVTFLFYKMVEEVVILGLVSLLTCARGGNAQAVHARTACAWVWGCAGLSLGHALRHAPGLNVGI